VSRIDQESWVEWRPDSRTLFIQYNMVMGRMPSAIEEIESRLAAGDLERVIVDVRHNGGGNNSTYHGFLRALREADAAGVPVYVIMSRITFSAAGNFVTELEQTTNAILVGENLGGSPNQYGDAVTVRLEHSGLVFRVAPQWIVKSDPADGRTTIEPDIPVPLTATDYFADVDAAMEAILADS
jgi:C-terminal processing protease CtpA/Prc